MDDYDNILSSVQIYGRSAGKSPLDGEPEKLQETMRIALDMLYTSAVEDSLEYHTPLQNSAAKFELLVSPSRTANASWPKASPCSRKNDPTGMLDQDELDFRALEGISYTLSLTPELLAKYQRAGKALIPDKANILGKTYKYENLHGDGSRWLPTACIYAGLPEMARCADADGIFEFLLIDVQIGVCLQESRIRQAVSTVQLYLRRCTLRLGKVEQVARNTVNMDRYRLWEVNRRVFLHLTGTTMRDDKTEVFRLLSSDILQNDLNSAKVVGLVKGYVYGIDTITDLDVQVYLWKNVENWSGMFHFFTRTRAAPYIDYYHTLDIVPSPMGRGSRCTGSPGPRLMSSSRCTRECVFLFFTQITLKTAPNGATKDKAINDISNEKPDASMASKYWQTTLDVRSAQSTDFLIQGHASGEGCLGRDRESPRRILAQILDPVYAKLLAPPAGSSRAAAPSPLPSNVPAPSTSIFVIDVERWINAGEGQQPRYLNYPLGGGEAYDK
ncbi:uncharacterized protein ATNIH1004_011730 [Aspergillus tanneri]|uniref:ABC toxin N-terminal domain-containing protein n=1 Tax=Aspergillus tanneri TaxID=1220188 RepID=A0A5M9M8C2_9EURO|nr:uncharacterized protein ATNIH1004_011730 [Aspergillus tanneri]KAA8641594.1 hypothetical protein ATNIH1004_011730 [Aspergillus tanneri]